MVAARVAGVPRPLSFMLSRRDSSVSVCPAFSIAESSVASVRCSGGLVALLTAFAEWTARVSPSLRAGSNTSLLFLRGEMSL